jgi:hypothetical protein
MDYARPSVDNLINNLPSVLKSSRQFLPWNKERDGKKVPLKLDGRPWGDFRDPKCWRTFNEAIDLLHSRRAFGIGLVLPSPEQIKALPEFNLIPGLVALDADAKRSSTAAPYNIPAHISDYVRSANSYSEFSPSLKGLRALVFGTLPTEKQNITRHFVDGTELSLYGGGWVTVSGLPFGNSPPTIEHRQDAIDRLVAELWPKLNARYLDLNEPGSVFTAPIHEGENFILDWSRSAPEGRIRQFIEGLGRTPKQLRDITEAWELNRGWNHGNTPDCSMYTKRIVEEALWLRTVFRWTLQDVVDIVITFCKKHRLPWSLGRAKKQVKDGLVYVSTRTCQRAMGGVVDFESSLLEPTPPPTLTCIGSQIIREQNKPAEPTLTSRIVSDLHEAAQSKFPDTLDRSGRLNDELKLSGGFRYKSAVRDAALQAISNHPGWVKVKTIAAETDMSAEAVRKQLDRLAVAGLVGRDRKGSYRKHHERKLRKLKPCWSKPIPKRRGTDQERKTLSWSELSKRGWPKDLIAKVFPEAGKDYIEREIVDKWTGHVRKARFYWVSRIKEIELQPWFEIERAKILRRSPAASQETASAAATDAPDKPGGTH